MESKDIKVFLDTADAEQRLALAKGGIIMAILQEKIRMGFTDDEIATVLSLRENSSVNEEMKFIWLKRLETYQHALTDN